MDLKERIRIWRSRKRQLGKADPDPPCYCFHPKDLIEFVIETKDKKFTELFQNLLFHIPDDNEDIIDFVMLIYIYRKRNLKQIFLRHDFYIANQTDTLSFILKHLHDKNLSSIIIDYIFPTNDELLHDTKCCVNILEGWTPLTAIIPYEDLVYANCLNCNKEFCPEYFEYKQYILTPLFCRFECWDKKIHSSFCCLQNA